jgi:hypothetical protein
VLVGNVVGEPCVTYSTGGFSKSLESEDFWERTGRAGGIFTLKVDKKTAKPQLVSPDNVSG